MLPYHIPPQRAWSTDLAALAVVVEGGGYGKVQGLPLRSDAEAGVLALAMGASAQRRGGLPPRDKPVQATKKMFLKRAGADRRSPRLGR